MTLFEQQFPYTAKYAAVYGKTNLPSTFEVPPRFKTVENLCKYCLQNGVQWVDIVPAPNGVAGVDYLL